jgi:hypothetical protein
MMLVRNAGQDAKTTDLEAALIAALA